MTVAALYIDPRGPYPKLLGPELCWDEQRDARTYAGPWPVVAHPPCGRWCKLAHVVEKRYGYKVGDDGGMFEHALTTVRRFGGVLEHPAESKAWQRFALVPPMCPGWSRADDAEWVCEVWQNAYGHRARKRTWVLYVGRPEPTEGKWSRAPGEVVISGMKNRCARPMSERMWQREARRTPVAFAEWLISLAEQAGLVPVSGLRAGMSG